VVTLGSNAHIFARPHRREELAQCFEALLGDLMTSNPGSAHGSNSGPTIQPPCSRPRSTPDLPRSATQVTPTTSCFLAARYSPSRQRTESGRSGLNGLSTQVQLCVPGPQQVLPECYFIGIRVVQAEQRDHAGFFRCLRQIGPLPQEP
jgi:hypothetical protein